MKKNRIFVILMLLMMMFMVGCNRQENPAQLATFEELVEINSYENLLKKYSNMYVKNVCTATNEEESYIEDAVFFSGNGKVNYHMRHTKVLGNTIIQDLSRVDNQWYYYDANDATYIVLELGGTYIFDYTVPNIFECHPLGKAYIDGDYIVHHAFMIYEGSEENSARRRDFVYYFDKESNIINKVEAIIYDNNHEVLATYIIDYVYDVKVENVFDMTIMDSVYNSEKRIDLEIVVDYNTSNEKIYSLVATSDAVLYAVIDCETYMLYTDQEFQNEVSTLEAYAGVKNMKLYAKKLEFLE